MNIVRLHANKSVDTTDIRHDMQIFDVRSRAL